MLSSTLASARAAPEPRYAVTTRRSLFACGVRLDGVRCRVRRAPSGPGRRGGLSVSGSFASDDGENGDEGARSNEEASTGSSASTPSSNDDSSTSDASTMTSSRGEDANVSESSAASAERREGAGASTSSAQEAEAGDDAKRETVDAKGSSKMILDSGKAVIGKDGDGPSGTVRLRRQPKAEPPGMTSGTIRKKVEPSRGAGPKRSYAQKALRKVRQDAADVLDNIRTSRVQTASTTTSGKDGVDQAAVEVASEAMALAKVTADALRGTGPITLDEWSAAMSMALSAVWRELLYRWSSKLKRSAQWVLAISAVMSAAFHYIVGPAFVSPRLPMIGDLASSAIGRPVRVGRCKSLSFMGVLGFGKFLEVGPVVLGPAETEKSIVEVDSVKISYNILRSILRRKLVTEVRLDGVNATLRQCANNSWFGYPEDTKPLSSRPVLNLAPSTGPNKKKQSAPSVELRVVRLERGNAKLHIVGDSEPRSLRNLHGKAVINHVGKVDIDLTMAPETRETPPTKRPTTMLAPDPVRNLRMGQTSAERKSLESEIQRGTNGGQIRVFASISPPAQRSFRAKQYPDLKVRAQLNNASASVLERVIPSLPIDIRGGRLDGEVRLTCNSPATWTFPEFGGQLKGKQLWFHFFDSTDDFADTDVDLVFEGQRMYIHGGEGHFGHIPLTVTGDLDLNSAAGEYRLSAQVSPVEVNDLRETLGVRPLPRPVAGSVKGFLYCSGPLESPVFTGRAETTEPTTEDIKKQNPGTEAAWAEESIVAAESEGAVGAYDRVPFKSANAVFSAEIKKGVFSLHSAEAVPVDGGKLRGSGKISIKPDALYDPEALDVEGSGVDLNFLKIAKRFSRDEAPPWLDRLCPSSPANVAGTFVGALSEPVLKANWTFEDDEYKGQVTITRDGVTTNVESPEIEMKASVATQFQPLLEQLKAVTVEEAIALGKPKVTDAEADVLLNGADVAAWITPEEATDTPDRVRLRLGGRARVKGKFSAPRDSNDEEIEDALPSFSGQMQLDNLRLNKLEFAPKMSGKLAVSESGLKLRAKNRSDELLETSVENGGKSAINIRRNNLKISADVDDYAGSLDVAGLLLDDLEIASLRGKVEAASARIDLRERVGEGSVQVKQPRLSGISGDLLEADASWADRIVSLERATLKQSKSQYDADGDYALHDEIWDSLPGPRVVAEEVEAVETEAEEKSTTDAVVADVPEEPVVAQPVEVLPHEEPPTEVAEHKLWKRLRVRRPAFVNNVTNRVKQLARNVGTKRSSSKREVIEEVKPQIPAPTQNESSVVVDPMDHQKPMVDEELNEPKPMEITDITHPSEEAVDTLVEDEEAPTVDEATETPKEDEASLDPVMATVEESSELAPKAKPSAAAKTIKSVLRSARNVVKPIRVNDKDKIDKPRVELQSYATEFNSDVSGTWRFRLAVPQADIEEMLPVLRLLTDIRKGATPEEYGRAKQAFLEGVEKTGHAIVDLARQVDDVSVKQKSEPIAESDASTEESEQVKTLPGLQDLKGGWHGVIQATGGGKTMADDESALDQTETVLFDVAGNDWQWGPYQVERVQAQGEANSSEGLKLKNLQVSSDAASLSVSGALGGPSQDATFSVRDFPAPLLGAFVGPMLPDQDMSDFPKVDGDLLVQGHLGGSVTSPEGEFLMHLRDGKIGNVKLKNAELNAELNEARRAEFEGEAVPAVGSGIFRIAGAVPLPEAIDQSLAVDWRVREHGVTLLTAFVPEIAEWQSGAADLSLHVRGTPAAPVFDGVMDVRKARILSPLLARPIYPVNATVRVQRNTLYADDIEAKSGKGVVKIKGAMPLLKPNRSAGGETWEGLVARADTQGGVKIKIDGLDVRARNVYSGQLNAGMVAKGTVTAPELSGDVRFSRGTAFVQQQAPPVDDLGQQGKPGVLSGERDSRGVLAGILERAARANDPNHGESEALVENELMNEKNLEKLQNLRLKGLHLVVGPEMSVVYPFVLNFGVSGELTLDGPVDPGALRPSGLLQFDRGDVNLVATQVRLDRDHPNRVVFSPEQGLDPYVDISFLGTDIRALIQGPASRWTDNLTLTSSAQTTPGEGDAALSPSEAARIFEGQLVESLLEQDGKIAFSNLASTTLASLMPKIEAGGNVGKARWRLTAAPSLPGLLSLDPDLDPFSNTGSFSLGSEAEIAFGDSLQATLSRNLDADEMRTELSLVYKLTSKLRLQLKSLSASATRVMFEFSTKD